MPLEAMFCFMDWNKIHIYSSMIKKNLQQIIFTILKSCLQFLRKNNNIFFCYSSKLPWQPEICNSKFHKIVEGDHLKNIQSYVFLLFFFPHEKMIFEMQILKDNLQRKSLNDQMVIPRVALTSSSYKLRRDKTRELKWAHIWVLIH